MERTDCKKSVADKRTSAGLQAGKTCVRTVPSIHKAAASSKIKEHVRQSTMPKEVCVKEGKPVLSGFANIGAVFGHKDKSDLNSRLVKMARKTGHLNLSNQGLTDVPEKVYSIMELTDVEAKELTMNMSFDFGQDEDRWWEMSDLTRLYLSSNMLTRIDDKIGQLLSLQILDLSDNKLTDLPQNIKELKKLTKLMLHHNEFRFMPEGICSLDDLRILLLDHNKIEKLPKSIGSLHVLESLELAHNCLRELPSSLGYLQRVTKLNVSFNSISKVAPEIGDMFSITELDLSHNELTAVPADSLSQLLKLRSLFLHHNQLTAIPKLTCPGLQYLSLRANRIKNVDPDAVEALTGLTVLELGENGIEDLPKEITVLQKLERLDISQNYLSNLPPYLGLLSHLQTLLLDGNPLRLVRRDIIQRGTPQLLKYLASKLAEPIESYPGVSSCRSAVKEVSSCLETDIPDQYQMKLSRSLMYNCKAPCLPAQLFINASLAGVKAVDISRNDLQELPPQLDNLHQCVAELIVSHNCLTSVPSFVGNFKYLLFLDVQNNRLSDLPLELSGLQQLREINLSYNRYTKMPSCIYSLSNLEILIASDNKIVCIEVNELCGLKRLATLNLQNNNIDFVPPELGLLTHIRSLHLEGNTFRVPRPAILAKGTEEIMSYLRSRIMGSSIS